MNSFCRFCQAILPVRLPGISGRKQLYCSRNHAALYRQANKPKKPFVAKCCFRCSKSFESNLSHKKFCSEDCRYKFQRESYEYRPIELIEWVCECGIKFFRSHWRDRRKYCDDCRLKYQRARYRMKTVRRQSLTVKPSRLSCDEVAARDNYVCHICDGWVDMSLPRTSGLGATVDHVIPLSKGGSDEPENLRLAHWACNVRKGSKVHG